MILIAYIFMCLVFGTTFLAIKIGLNEGLPPFYMAALRFLIAALVVLAILSLKNFKTFKQSLPTEPRVYLEIFFLGVFQTGIPFAALFWAEQHITSGTAALLVATAPVFIALLSKIDRRGWLGVVLALGGVYLIVSPDLGQGLGQGATGWQTQVAKLSIILSELAFAYGIIRSKKLLNTGFSPQLFNGLQMLFAALTLGVISLFAESPTQTAWTLTGTLALLYLAVVASVIASGVYYWMLQVTNPLFPTTWTYVSPVIAMIAGALVLQEKVTWAAAFGTALVLIGVIVINFPRPKSLPQNEASIT